jgi:transcriptional regulator with XRE-family HTH domain
MPALAATLDADKPVLLPVGQELLRDAMQARGLSVTALAATLGVSRKHLSNVLNRRAPLVEPLAHRLASAVEVDPVLLEAAIRVPRRIPLARYGAMKGWIVAHGDLTEPMEGWDMLED